MPPAAADALSQDVCNLLRAMVPEHDDWDTPEANLTHDGGSCEQPLEIPLGTSTGAAAASSDMQPAVTASSLSQVKDEQSSDSGETLPDCPSPNNSGDDLGTRARKDAARARRMKYFRHELRDRDPRIKAKRPRPHADKKPLQTKGRRSNKDSKGCGSRARGWPAPLALHLYTVHNFH